VPVLAFVNFLPSVLAMNRHLSTVIGSLLPLFVGLAALAQQPPTKEEATAAMKKAVTFFQEKVSADGGYLWRYSEDLSLREGEEKATAMQAWLQPPGTPAVGEAFLAAYERTKEKYLLDAAVHTARALVKGQLHSGCWAEFMEFDPEQRKNHAYRVDGPAGPRARNMSTFDDNKSQSATQFMMHVDRALGFKDQSIHEATLFALDSIIKVQYPNGAWPQRFSGPPNAADHPVVKANYPDTWSRTYPGVNYQGFYTLNDNAQADVIATLFEAADIYGDNRYTDSAKKGGDFLILAQMPDPQPAWAQQYNAQMQPVWARKFEPASITGGESQGAIRILMDVYRHTGDKKYLAPIPAALDYLEKSQLPTGRLARFYELKTNKPLYFTKQYELVYTSDDMPTHYAFIVGSNIPRLREDYEKLLATDTAKLKPAAKPEENKLTPALSSSARAAIDSLDPRGAWPESGRLRAGTQTPNDINRVITTQTFIRNLNALSRFIAASK
jgi:PelA/Pel-15E family pectate lyase